MSQHGLNMTQPYSKLLNINLIFSFVPGFGDSRKCHTYSPASGLDSVSLGLIHSNLNVITSSSTVIQKVANGFLTSSDPSQAASGPLTRSRKRRLFEGDTGDKMLEKPHHLGKTKVQRAGTIVIE